MTFLATLIIVKDHISAGKEASCLGSQSVKPLTPLVNPIKIYFLDLDSSLLFFQLSTKLYVGQLKIYKVL